MTKQALTSARMLDITRLARRAGRVPTGVDRVELAYLRALLRGETALFGLARTRLGYVLLDQEGMQGFLDRIEGRVAWGAPDRLSGISRAEMRNKRADSDLRRLSLARCLPQRLGRMLAQQLPAGATYLNVGHSNVTDRVLHSVKHRAGMRIAILIHDTIPLDFPQFQRLGSVPSFREMLKRVRAMADLVICNSDQTRADVERYMKPWGAVPECVVAPLGVDLPVPAAIPQIVGFDPAQPYFVTVGTIEPRKNHALLLSLWEEMAQEGDCPQLVICGQRGWENADVFDWLDHHPLMGQKIFEAEALGDGQVAALLSGAAAMLFPSHAEGYGLPPVEAAAQGIPVLCNDLPVYREVLGDIPVYAGIHDRYLWKHKIKGLMRPIGADGQVVAAPRFIPPSWQSHFNVVLRLT